MENKKLHIIPPKETLEKNFKVPSGYFEQNAVELKKIAQSAHIETKVFYLKPFVGWLSAAAAVALIVFVMTQRNTTTSTILTDDDLYDLVEVGYVSFNSDEILEQVDLNDLNEYFDDPTEAYDYLENNDLDWLEENMIYELY